MRRLAIVVALVCSALVSVATPASVHSTTELSEPEQIAHTQVIQTTGPDASALSWGLDRIDQRSLPLSGSYSYVSTGAGVKAYIVDSGIKADHVQFAGRVVNGWSYRNTTQAQLNTWRATLGSCKTPSVGAPSYSAADHPYDVDTFDYTPPVATDFGSPDNDGHGTHVAGIIGGSDTGVAKGVTLVPVRVLNSCGEGVTSMVLKGLQWILADHQMGEPAVVNMSIGFDMSSTSIDLAIKDLIAEGVVVVAAAGNSSATACNTTPAGTAGTISVGASTSTDYEASYSNYGQCVDLLAPGSYIKSTWHFDNNVSANPYKTLTGTSMAAPHVAGVVARYLQGLTTTATTVDEAATWLLANATQNALTFFHSSPPRNETMTPNKLLSLVVFDAVTGLTATSQSRQLAVSWNAVAGTSYVVTSSPGTATCSTSGASCVLTDLINGVNYSISVVSSNTYGDSRVAVITATPDGEPEVPARATSLVENRSITLSWPAVTTSVNLTYVVTSTPGNLMCSTTELSCTIEGLTYGTNYTFAVTTRTASGRVTSATVSTTARPGFTVKKDVVKRGKTTPLSWYLSSISSGKKTWSESGPCSIQGTKLVAPKKTTACVLILKIAKTKKYPAMSTKVTIAVQ